MLENKGDSEGTFGEGGKKMKHNKEDFAGRIKKSFEDAGFEVPDVNHFFRGIQDLYVRSSIEEVIEQELPLILEADPQFFLRNQIYLGNISDILADLYGEGTLAYEKVGKHALPDAIHSFKVTFRHVRFFMLDHPDKEKLQHQVDEIQRILRGDYIDEFRTGEWSTGEVIRESTVMDINSVPIPNILDVHEEHYHYFASFDGAYGVVRKALPFIEESESRRMAMKIHSQKGDPSERAMYAKSTIESYLREARSVVADKDKPIPDYYDTNSNVYKSIIKPARDSILI